jgi:hypothetical protein
LLSGETFAVGAGHSQLENLAIFQVAQSQAAGPSDEDLEHGPAQAEATGLTWKPTDYLSSPTNFFE